MKPHEEQWYVAFGSVVVQVGDAPGDDDFLMETGGTSGRAARRSLAAAAPDMARAGLAIYARVEEAARAMPGARTADDLAAMDTSVTVPASLIRDLFAAMRKGGVQP